MKNSKNQFLEFTDSKDIIDEEILFSDTIIKINPYNMYQKRYIIITHLALYNIKKKVIKRRIELRNIKGITVSTLTDEFVIHGLNSEYDYLYVSTRRYLLLQILLKAYKDIMKSQFEFCEVNGKSLKYFVTTKKEKYKNSSLTKMNKEALSSIDDYLAKTAALPSNESSVFFKESKCKTLFSHHEIASNVSLEDFKILKVLGRGTFGKVYLVEFKCTKEIFAMKALKKDKLIDQNQIENTFIEKKILQTLNHPFLVKMVFCFQTEERLFFVINFCRGGELFQHLRKCRVFNEEKVKFYAAIIGMGLGYLHSKDIIYRDIKPENILMDSNGYLRLTDFGMAKMLRADQKANSFCGTPEYIAPEIIQGNSYNYTADWWSYGILIYEMLHGIPPYYSKNVNKMYDLILNGTLSFSKNIYISGEAKDCILQLLNRTPEKRLGAKNDFDEIKTHSFFNGIDFDKLLKQEYEAPFKLALSEKFDFKFFDSQYTNEEVIASVISERNLAIIKENQEKFKDFK